MMSSSLFRVTARPGPIHGEARPKTRPQGAHCKDAGDESQLTSQCTPTTPHTRTARALAACSPALTPAQESNGIFACEACLPACRPAHAPCSARSHLARPLPCVDRTIGERSLTTPRGLLAQLMELTTYCSDCAPAHAPCSATYALHLRVPPRPFLSWRMSARVALSSRSFL